MIVIQNTITGRADVLYSNVKKAYEHYHDTCKSVGGLPMSYSTVAAAIKSNKVFSHELSSDPKSLKFYIGIKTVF